jgi:hypothetical protein
MQSLLLDRMAFNLARVETTELYHLSADSSRCHSARGDAEDVTPEALATELEQKLREIYE